VTENSDTLSKNLKSESKK